MLTLLAGAGLSRWAADLPVARDLFDFAITPFGPKEGNSLRRVQELKRCWDQENPQGLSEAFVGYALDVGGRESALVQWYVVRRLSEPYLWQEWHAQRRRRHVLMIDDHRKWTRPGVSQTAHFIRQLGSMLSGIVTTNYDLLIEYALGTASFNYGIVGERLCGRGAYPVSQWANPVTLRGALPLAKVHGSISWDEAGRYTDGRRGLTGSALIIAPKPAKSPPRSLEREWALAAKLLGNSKSLVVFGFAFNAYDQILLKHLESFGHGIRRVLLVDIAPNEKAAASVWPSAQIRSVTPPPDGDDAITAWIQNRAV